MRFDPNAPGACDEKNAQSRPKPDHGAQAASPRTSSSATRFDAIAAVPPRPSATEGDHDPSRPGPAKPQQRRAPRRSARTAARFPDRRWLRATPRPSARRLPPPLPPVPREEVAPRPVAQARETGDQSRNRGRARAGPRSPRSAAPACRGETHRRPEAVGELLVGAGSCPRTNCAKSSRRRPSGQAAREILVELDCWRTARSTDVIDEATRSPESSTSDGARSTPKWSRSSKRTTHAPERAARPHRGGTSIEVAVADRCSRTSIRSDRADRLLVRIKLAVRSDLEQARNRYYAPSSISATRCAVRGPHRARKPTQDARQPRLATRRRRVRRSSRSST